MTNQDFLGNVVLERRNGNNDTYYVYEKNRLVMVLPPECQNVTNNSEMVYRYQYDSRGRCVQKTLPGNVIIKYWYDKHDRLAFMQDGLLKASSQYRFYLYDDLGRLAIQGLTSDASVLAKTNFTAKVIYGSGVQAVGDTGYYIVNDSDKFAIADTEIVNYYDGYDCLSNSFLNPVMDMVGTIPSVCTTSLMTAQVVATSDDKKLCRVIFYDSKSNITSVQEFREDGTQLKTSHKFSPTNKPVFSITSVVRNGKTISVQDSMVYSPVSDDVLEHWQKVASRPFVKVESYQYDDLGKVKTLSYYNDKLSTDYTYDLHGWTKSINSIVNSTNELLFGEKLYYADAYGPKCYNGNISEVRWITSDNPMGDKVFTGYRYFYDGMDRLALAKCTYGHWVYSDNTNAGSLGIFDFNISYDANSAIKTLKRTGKINTSGEYGLIDDLTYYYTNGRLVNVTDNGANAVYDGAFNFVDNTIDTHGSANDYAYNANGALTRDYNKGISSITYNKFGSPQKVTFVNRNSVEYVYSADGIKLKVRHITAVPQDGTGSSSSSGTNYILSWDSIDYIGDFVYRKNRFSRYNWGNGYIVPTASSSGYAYRFYFKDHQGNNRVVTTDLGSVMQTSHYYPDGVTHNMSTGQGYQKYKYNGKELDRMHGLDWYDYGARQYDPTTGMFTSMDPLCEKYYHISPYAYCAGNPVKYVDPDGRDWYQNNKTSYYTWFNGDAVRDGFTHIGGKGSLLGEFESKINKILIDVYKKENGLYSEGRIVDITDSNKGAIIPSQLSKMDDFLDEFVFGYGPEISILTDNHPYTKALQTDGCILESQQKLLKDNTTIPGQITKVNRSWGPLDVLYTTSIAKQFVGSYTFDSYTSYDKNHLLNIIYDTKNFRSLFYHIPGTGYLNHSRNSIVKPFANTYQFYIWKSRK